ncbi:MAG: hypothetical protein ACI8RE_003451, partial [Ilumatobacter sp.]
MYGADAEELERIATQFRRTADELDGEGSALTGILNRVAWLGDLATRYLDNWTGVQIPKIGLSTQFLREAADQMDANAREQRATSSAGTGALGPVAPTPTGGDADLDGVWGDLKDILDKLGLPKDVIKLILEGLEGVIGADQLRMLLDNLLTPGLMKAFEVAGHVMDVASVVIDLAKDFANHSYLPMDERIVHAIADAAIRFGLDQGVEIAAQWAMGALAGAFSGGSATLVGAAAGKIAGVVLSEVIEMGIDALDGAVDIVDTLADLGLERY